MDSSLTFLPWLGILVIDIFVDFKNNRKRGDFMNFWKIAAGAAIGIGAIAAAPFTGGGSIIGAATLASSLAGAGTIAAATAAGVAGAGAGYAMSKADDKRADEHRNEGRKEAEEDIKTLQNALNEYQSKLSSSKQYFDLLIALSAVGFATANCDGEICEKERLQIADFVTGVATSNLPDEVKSIIKTFEVSPPSLSQAFELANKLPDYPNDLFEEVINVVMHADGVVHASEERFKRQWLALSAA